MVVLLVLLVLKQKMVKVMAVVMVLVLKKEREEEVPTARCLMMLDILVGFQFGGAGGYASQPVFLCLFRRSG